MLFSAGVDTSSVTMHWSVGLMAEFPEIQAKVAAEVDKVVGRDRLPSLNDRENLPYTLATLYEVMRFSSVVPLALPHATSQDVNIGQLFVKIKEKEIIRLVCIYPRISILHLHPIYKSVIPDLCYFSKGWELDRAVIPDHCQKLC
ncbi:Cytochrome P450 1B1 [Holothuria leucospilota]|uniref:Cytochrome P450 1B1 n=1 Tax=Holothuria leucospilota TaxID=206669 RepID=A0A9Q1H8U8_HOLLE|nr:Cytochrome P450 1B1 [Holothuria leucospilota]